MQLDEMWSFVGSKGNKQWIWLAIDADSREIVGVFVGDRSRQAAKGYGNRYLRFIASALSATPISGKPMNKYCPVTGIEQLVKKQEKPVILSGSTTPCGKEWGA